MKRVALHIEKGKEGEGLASSYLRKKGFEVKICNWRSGHYEIDIIATKNGIVHFVEVKTRHSLQFGYPEESVTRRKLNNMINAACCFLSKYPECLKIEYDILSILRLPGQPIEYYFIEDVCI
jgi:putative endonuclease